MVTISPPFSDSFPLDDKTDNMPLFIFHPLDGKESDFALTHYLLILLPDQHLNLMNGTLLELRQLEIQLELGLMEFNVLI